MTCAQELGIEVGALLHDTVVYDTFEGEVALRADSITVVPSDDG